MTQAVVKESPPKAIRGARRRIWRMPMRTRAPPPKHWRKNWGANCGRTFDGDENGALTGAGRGGIDSGPADLRRPVDSGGGVFGGVQASSPKARR